MAIEYYGRLNRYMNEVVNAVMQDQILLKFLYYNTHDDVLSMPDLTHEQKKSMINDTIFKYKKIPVLNDRVMKTYLAMEYGEIDRMNEIQYRTVNSDFYKPTVDFFIITSDGNIETKNGNRVYAIEDRLAHLFHLKSHNTTLGYSRITKSDSIYGLQFPYSGREVNVQFWDTIPGKYETPWIKTQ